MTESFLAVAGALFIVAAAFWYHPPLGLGVLGLMMLVAGLFFDFGSER